MFLKSLQIRDTRAADKGYPIVRSTFLHYPDDENVYGLRYQFMYGSEFMVAPVLEKGAKEVRLYLPKGEWVNVWTQQEFDSADGEWVTVAAPLGQPGLFYRKGSPEGQQLMKEMQALGLL